MLEWIEIGFYRKSRRLGQDVSEQLPFEDQLVVRFFRINKDY